MKRLIVILLVIIPFLQSSAQAQSVIRHTINRVDKQVSSPLPTTDYAHNYHSEKKISTIQTAAAWVDYPSLEVTMGQTTKEFDARDQGIAFEGSIKNISANTVKLNFFRNQILPNDTVWSSTVCLNVCYSPGTSYLEPKDYVSIPAGGSVPFLFHVYTTEVTSKDESLIAHIRLDATGTFPGDTASFTFIAKSKAASAVNDDQQTSLASTKIISLYPSPLINGSAIKVILQSPRETSFTYSIFDAFGRQVAFGSPSHRLSAGSNTLEIKSLDGLASGSYMLKINFAGGGSDGRVFQVIN